ncbi:MAG: hypothetical protein ACXVCP_00665 [Bdellovibrio sp.]
MKTNKNNSWHQYILSFLAFLIFATAGQSATAAKMITLADVTAQAKKQNLLIKQKLVEAHQSQQLVQYNRAGLIPKLNLFNLLSTGGTLVGAAGIIGDIAPFLIPANWFRIKEVQISKEYQKKSYQALWGNELLSTRSLYLTIVSDLNSLEIYKDYQKNLIELKEIAETRDQFGGDRLGALEMLLAQIAKVQEDQVSLKDIINQEFYNLTQLTLMDPKTQYDFDLKTKISSSWKYIDSTNLILSAQDSSPEVKSYDNLIQMLTYIKKEIQFSFFGSSQLSRGVAGGVFDDLPINGGWSVTNKISFALTKTKEEQLKTQQLGVKETLKRQILRLIDQDSFLNEKETALLARKTHLENQWEILLDRLQFGMNAAMDELIYNRQAYAETQIALININILHSQLNDKAHRILWRDDYKDFSLPAF